MYLVTKLQYPSLSYTVTKYASYLYSPVQTAMAINFIPTGCMSMYIQ